MPPPFGFIMIRHVNSKHTNQYWIECYQCIRKLYPETPIIIIDDNSIQSFITMPSDLHMTNCNVVDGHLPGRAELLPFYFFLKNHYFDKAFILHDSLFLQRQIDVDSIQDVRFIYHFDSSIALGPVLRRFIPQLIHHLTDHESLLKRYSERSFYGCFGVMCIITWDCLHRLEEKYNWSRLIDHIKTRKQREALERIWAIMLYDQHFISMKDRSPSVCGNIVPIYGSNTYRSYMRRRYCGRIAIKVWTGR